MTSRKQLRAASVAKWTILKKLVPFASYKQLLEKGCWEKAAKPQNELNKIKAHFV